jgi:hypothetical protein
MKVGDKVLVEAVVTAIGQETVNVAISRDGHPQRLEHVRTTQSQVRTVRQKAAA